MKSSLARTLAAASGAALLASSSATAGNGAKSPSQLLAAAVSAAKTASSVHIVGSGIEAGRTNLSLDLKLTAGKGGGGEITIGGDKIDIILLRPFVYLEANAQVWRQYGGSHGATIAQLLAGRWVKMSALTKGFAGIVALTDISAFVSAMASQHGPLVSGGTKTIHGRRAVGVVDTSKSGGGTLWVAATGPALPLELTETGGSGRVDFENWNAPVRVTAPASSVGFSHVK